jgi:hypothetical protein
MKHKQKTGKEKWKNAEKTPPKNQNTTKEIKNEIKKTKKPK